MGSSETGRSHAASWELEEYDTDELLGKIFYFFECQESGKLRKGHRVKWRGDSYVTDGQEQGLDLEGGWHDAGDHLKLMFPMCWAVLQIAWAMLDGEKLLREGKYGSATNWAWAVQTLVHGVTFLTKCHSAPASFVVQVGDVDGDHCKCIRAELDAETERPVLAVSPYTPGADVLANAAAMFAASSAALKGEAEHEALAQSALRQALELYGEASKHPGCYSDSIPESGKTYKSDCWQQYMFLAAAWLFKVTGDDRFRVEAIEWQAASEAKAWWSDYSWQNVYFGACAVLWSCSQDTELAKKLEYFAVSHLEQKNGIKRTPCGLTFVTEWGSCRHAAGAAAILACYARHLAPSKPARATEVLAFAKRQIAYICGAGGHSFVIGFGHCPPQKPHHRDSALVFEQSGHWECFQDQSKGNPNELTGGLCGGPLADGSWQDDREDYKANEVALDYNAALLIGVVSCVR